MEQERIRESNCTGSCRLKAVGYNYIVADIESRSAPLLLLVSECFISAPVSDVIIYQVVGDKIYIKR